MEIVRMICWREKEINRMDTGKNGGDQTIHKPAHAAYKFTSLHGT